MNSIKVVTLCGSTKFKTIFTEVEKKLTKTGVAVLSPQFSYINDRDEMTKEEKMLLGKIHLKKIQISDEIFVIDFNNYLGESTKKEIEYARLNHKNRRYYSKEKDF